MIKVFITPEKIQITKEGMPTEGYIADRKNISDSNIFQAHPNFTGDKNLVFYCTDRKRIVRRYGYGDWGKIERYK